MYKLITNVRYISTIILMILVLQEVRADNATSIIMQEGDIVVTTHEAQLMLDDMSWQQKEKILSRKDKLKNLLTDALILKKRVKKAREKMLDKSSSFKWRLKKYESNLLVKTLIRDYKLNIKLPENLESLARDYYDAHPEEYTSKEEINAAHILLEFDGNDSSEGAKENILQKAKGVLQELQDGKDFKELAKKYSDDKGSAKSGGEMGFFTKGKTVPSFEIAAFSLKNINDLSDIVESPFGYHIIKLLDRKKAKITPYDEVKEALLTKQKNRYVNSKANEYMETLSVSDATTIFIPAFDKFYDKAVKNKIKVDFN